MKKYFFFSSLIVLGIIATLHQYKKNISNPNLNLKEEKRSTSQGYSLQTSKKKEINAKNRKNNNLNFRMPRSYQSAKAEEPSQAEAIIDTAEIARNKTIIDTIFDEAIIHSERESASQHDNSNTDSAISNPISIETIKEDYLAIKSESPTTNNKITKKRPQNDHTPNDIILFDDIITAEKLYSTGYILKQHTIQASKDTYLQQLIQNLPPAMTQEE
jgi:hypothetical protein